jgi:hypothetical protein
VPGSRVRVTGICAEEEYAPRRVRKVCPKNRGTVLAIGADALVLQSEETGDSVVMLLGSVSRLDLHSGRRSAELKGLFIGTGIGAVVGMVGGMLCDDRSLVMSQCNPLETNARGAVVGAAFGSLIGLFATADRWERIPLDQLRVQPLVTTGGRLGLMGSIRLW